MLIRMRRFVALTIAVFVMGLGACGEQAGDPLAGESEADREIAERALKSQQRFSDATLRFAQAEGEQNVAAMQTAGDQMINAVRKTRDAAFEIDDGKLRRMLGDVASDQESLTGLIDEYLTYLEDDTVPQDPAYEQQLYGRITQASERAGRSSLVLLNKMLDNASPEQRKRVSEAIRAYESQIEAAYEK